MFEEKKDGTGQGTPQATDRARGTATANAGTSGTTGRLKLDKIGDHGALVAIKEVNKMVEGSKISVTEIKSTRKTKVKWPGALIKLEGMEKSIAVIFPDSGVKLSHLRNKMTLLPSDAFDKLYKEAIMAVGGDNLDRMVTYISINEDKVETLTRLINGLIDEYNGDNVVALAKFSKDSIINITMDPTPGDAVSEETGFPVTKQFEINVDVKSLNQKVHSIHHIDDVSITVSGYTRPLVVNATEQTVNAHGQPIVTNKLKFSTGIILNDIPGETKTMNKLLTGVLGVIATNQSLPNLMASIAQHEHPDLVGIEHIANPDAVKNGNPLHSLRPDQLAERLAAIFTDRQTISVEVSLCTMPELYYYLNDLHNGHAETTKRFYDSCEETFGVRPPEGIPIFLKERIEYPVGFVNTEVGRTPITSVTPSRIFAETGKETAMLELMNAELGISIAKPAIEEHINIVADIIPESYMYERGLRYQFNSKFLEYIIAATGALRLHVDNKYIVEPSIHLGMNNFAVNNAVDLSQLTSGLNLGVTSIGGYQDVSAHPTFKPRMPYQ